ncbi:hypothetical protein KC19_7G091000 [Ceratodon purpureus]|uniref:4a-hydroxytetrahydrobiopterin dehydratase n=1 Tax=Ceratodon purpureus TaxID=3225 RepID=A0A8T0H6G1_CERPU|nr:hypothetical protein KC19_7G091000 [Ceratodon purpureus]
MKKKVMRDINRPPDTVKTSRKGTSGRSELPRVGQAAQGLAPLQEQEFDALKHGQSKLFSDDDLQERLKFLSNWKLSPDRRSISRTFQARNFAEGINIFNAVAKLAEEYDHFPDLHIMDNRKVTVVLTANQIQGLSSSDINMAERFNNIDIPYAETLKDFEHSPRLFEVERSEDSSQMQPMSGSVQPLGIFSQQHSPEAADNPQSRKSDKISFPERQHVTSLMERTGEDEVEAQEVNEKSAPALLHSLILIFAEAGPGGLAVQEAVRRIRKQGLPGLREKGKAAQVANVTRNHPDFVACDDVECFALRKSLLRSFQCGSLDPEEYADEKKMEATVLETYAASAAALELKLSSPKSTDVSQD